MTEPKKLIQGAFYHLDIPLGSSNTTRYYFYLGSTTEEHLTVSVSSQLGTRGELIKKQGIYTSETLPFFTPSSSLTYSPIRYRSYANCTQIIPIEYDLFEEKYLGGPYNSSKDFLERVLKGVQLGLDRGFTSEDHWEAIWAYSNIDEKSASCSRTVKTLNFSF